MGIFGLAALLFLPLLAEANYAQIHCVSEKAKDNSRLELFIELNVNQQPLWPHRAALVQYGRQGRTLLFTGVDVFEDFLFEPGFKGEKKFVSKNYDQPKFRHRQIAFTLDTLRKRRLAGQDPFPTALDYSDRRGPILEEEPMECRWRSSKPFPRS